MLPTTIPGPIQYRMKHPLFQLFLSRMREFYREPHALFWVYGFPLILAVGLGLAFSDREPEPLQVDIQQTADQALSDELRQHLETAGLIVSVHDEDECRRRLRTGRSALFVVPQMGGFRYVYDRTRPESLTIRTAVDAVVTRWRAGVQIETRDSEEEVSHHHTSGTATWETSDSLVRERGSRYIDFLIPGLMGMNLMGGGLFGVGFSVVDMRVRKLLKRLVATPMKRSHLLLAMLGGRFVMLLPEMGFLLLVATFGFGVPLRGNLLLLTATVCLGAFAFTGIGLLLASRTEKLETISGLVNLVALPGWILSGTFFSAKRFPDTVQPVIQALPLTQLNEALREVMLEGATVGQVGWRLAALAAWGGVTFVLALKWFRWR